ncbi:contact-dependent growth inhibition system immunity protein [Rufibacter sp. DG15C]|uniref:contact-dependent growth inhibition system immunity protein n=1 Tax=Rufibacter sp. DG15C TaxID=1379909 RepID=UPI0018D44998|nr:contact-dependent growth inhibition system immunity protein [Rufibacter sp. DG15C]
MNKSKVENNWLSMTIESLEKDYWGEPEYNSHLVTTCHRLRKKPLKDFETEDLRIMIGQNIGLKYLVPIALDKLDGNILSDGDLYDGDLLQAVLKSDKGYWKAEKENWIRMCNIFNRDISLLENHYNASSIKDEWFSAYAEFERFN